MTYAHPEPPRRSTADEARLLEERVLPFLLDLLELEERSRTDLTADAAAEFELLHAGFEQLLRPDSGFESTALGRIARQLDLDTADVLVLLLAAAPYLDDSVKVRLRKLQGSVLADRCSVGLAMHLIRRGATRRLELLSRFEPERPLMSRGLVRVEPAADARPDSVLEQALTVPRRTVDLLLGIPRLDDRARPFCELERPAIPLERVVLPSDKKAEVMSLVRHCRTYKDALGQLGFDKAIPYGRAMVLLFSGAPGTGKTLLARALACELGRPLLRARADKLAEAREPLEDAIEALFQDAELQEAVLFFDECEALFSKRSATLGCLLQALERFDGLAVLATNMPETLDRAVDRRIVHRVDFEVPEPAEREQIWEMHLPPSAETSSDVDIPLLANLFNLPGGAIKNAVLVAFGKAVDRSPARPVIDMGLLRRAAEGQLRSNLEELAHRSRIGLRLADLVLPEAENRKVAEIVAACRNKDLVQNRWGFGRRLVTGKGIAVLFDGPPGTGKTLCAEILAAELDKPIYRVHIPNVVSKWVGETEKNISEIFSRARATQAVLLFDEADSLFSARTEVKSSNDRFANQEVNLLLQEIERGDGIVIMTTNLFGGLDEALRRRIQYRVTFPMPDAVERARIWEALVPAETPVASDVSFERLGQLYEFAGGAIKNAVVRAAYRAYAEGSFVTMAHLTEAGRVECEALGIAVREGRVLRRVGGSATGVA